MIVSENLGLKGKKKTTGQEIEKTGGRLWWWLWQKDKIGIKRKKKNCGDDFDKKLKLEHVNDWKGNLLLVLDNACNIIC